VGHFGHADWRLAHVSKTARHGAATLSRARGFANVVSAPITISANATSPAIHGDAQLFEKLMSRRVKTNSSPFVVGKGHNR
jgi:hypothetical protein